LLTLSNYILYFPDLKKKRGCEIFFKSKIMAILFDFQKITSSAYNFSVIELKKHSYNCYWAKGISKENCLVSV